MTEPRNQSSANNREQGNSNDDAICYSNRHACVSMGKIHKPGDVTSAFCVETADGRHNFFMDADGPRKGWTTSTSPGVFQVECGEHPDIEDVDEKEALDSLVFICKNGNTVIRNKNGKIRLEATDIEMIATGEGTARGNIRIEAKETIDIECKKLLANSKCLTKLTSTGVVEISANACMKIYASIIRGVTDAVKVKDSKVGGKKFCETESNPNS